VAFFVKSVFDFVLMLGNPIEVFVEIIFGELAETQKIGFTHSRESNGRESRALIERSCQDLPKGESAFA